ncbi:D-tyrosyl-tRNA(Tyr) deacylase [sediment metagenome]|uniref:D-tyrosyl-tRNA(Tyr) deacylase n=1 Tax=sediment metagenome TaxID=749907 RepID=D9PJ25_9ZZZZ
MQKGNKIDFSDSGLFDYSQNIYNKVIGELEKSGTPFKTGEFGAKMEVSSTNLGPLNYIFEF